VPEGVREHFAEGIAKRGRELRAAWESAFRDYKREFPALADEIERMQKRGLPEDWDRELLSLLRTPRVWLRATLPIKC
jgi:transketolase